MRHLRDTEARRHVREEIPFFTGRRIERRRDRRGAAVTFERAGVALGCGGIATPAAAGGPSTSRQPVAYDAILLAGFGGPEGQDDVIPFLRNVTRGRGIPDERLEEVAHHYRHFGGVSPINAQNRALKAALEAELAERGIDLPVLWGNRNWDPYLADALREANERGFTAAHRPRDQRLQLLLELPPVPRGLRARRSSRPASAGELRIDKVRQFFDHPGFVAAVHRRRARGDRRTRPSAASTAGAIRVLFSTHSIPTDDAERGPRDAASDGRRLRGAAPRGRRGRHAAARALGGGTTSAGSSSTRAGRARRPSRGSSPTSTT